MSNVLVGCTQHNESTKSSNAVNSITSSVISEASFSEQSEESKVESSIVETSKVTPVVQSPDEASDTTSKIQSDPQAVELKNNVFAGPLLKENYYDILDTNHYTYDFCSDQSLFDLSVDGNKVKLVYQKGDQRLILLHTDGVTYSLNDIQKTYAKIEDGAFATPDDIISQVVYTDLKYLNTREETYQGKPCTVEQYEHITKDNQKETFEFFFNNKLSFVKDESQSAAINLSTYVDADDFVIPDDFVLVNTTATS